MSMRIKKKRHKHAPHRKQIKTKRSTSQNFNQKHNVRLQGNIIPHIEIDYFFGTDSKYGGVHIRVVVLNSVTCSKMRSYIRN